MPKLSESEESMEKLVTLKQTMEEWHINQKEKIVRKVMLLKMTPSPIEKVSSTYLKDIVDDALTIVENIQIEGPQTSNE